MTLAHSDRGFSLLEALVATTLVATALGGLTHLAVVATHANRSAHAVTMAALLASERLATLYNDAQHGTTAPAVSPPDALDRDVDGFCVFFDARGTQVFSGTPSPPAATFVLRWSVGSVPGGPPRARVLQVVVRRWSPDAREGGAGPASSLVHLVTVSRGAE